jgi:hypothetical protein
MVKSTLKKGVSFVTKGGKEISFKSSSDRSNKSTTHVKQLEKRMSAMEKAVMKYNIAIQKHEAKKAKAVEGEERQSKKAGVKTVAKVEGKKGIKL